MKYKPMKTGTGRYVVMRTDMGLPVAFLTNWNAAQHRAAQLRRRAAARDARIVRAVA